MSENTKERKARELRYKRPALASMDFVTIRSELDDMRETCDTIHWWSDQDEDTLLAALHGDEEDVYEFKMAFSALEAKAEELARNIGSNMWDDEFERTYNDCIVAMVGDCYRSIGYDDYEEDYCTLTSYEQRMAYTDAGKRMMRRTKADMLSTIGQCMRILLSYLDLRQQYDYLKAAFDVLRGQNKGLLETIKAISATYEEADKDGWDSSCESVKHFDQLLAAVPQRAWIE